MTSGPEGEIALVTGGGAGIGRAVAEGFANEGVAFLPPALAVHMAKENCNEDLRTGQERVLAQKPCIVPIPGTTKLQRPEENVKAARMELTSDDLAAIRVALGSNPVRGTRYPELGMRLIDKIQSRTLTFIFLKIATSRTRYSYV